jgi:HK97 gp10 family phage protein
MAILKSNLSSIALRCPEKAQEALLETGKDIFAVSQQLVPVDTSSLKKSGGVEPVDSKTVQVGYGVEGEFFSGREPSKYAAAVEYGTSRAAAQPYLTPAFTQSSETFRSRLFEKMKALVQEESFPG